MIRDDYDWDEAVPDPGPGPAREPLRCPSCGLPEAEGSPLHPTCWLVDDHLALCVCGHEWDPNPEED